MEYCGFALCVAGRTFCFYLKGEKMKHKNNYQSPEIELVKINAADVISTSGLNDIKPDLGENDGEWL